MPSCVSFHTLNAHGTADGVLVHMCQFPRLYLLAICDIGDPQLARDELNVHTGADDISTPDLGLVDKFKHSTIVGLPFVYPGRVGRFGRYGFANMAVPSLYSNNIRNRGVGKFDLHTVEPAAGILFTSDGLDEESAVPKKDVVNEDDDYLLQLVRSDDSDTIMNVYDAVDMCDTPIAMVHAPDGFQELG